MLFKLKQITTGEVIPPLVEIVDSTAEMLTQVLDDDLTLGKLQNGSRFTLEPLDHAPLQAVLLEMLMLLDRMDQPNRSINTLLALQDGVVSYASSLFKTYQVYLVQDVVADLQTLVNYNAGKMPGHELPLVDRNRLDNILPPECFRGKEES